MADARSEILGAVRRAVAGAGAVAVPRDYAVSRELGDVVALFAERVADYQARVRTVSTGGLSGAIAEVFAGKRIAVPADVPVEWRESTVDWMVDEPALGVAELDAVDGVLTGATVAIAETGTIVLDGGVAQGRRALTLVPDHHVCVVLAGQVVGTVPEAVARLDAVRPLTFISGPSATSDIELSRVEGVHGPRSLDVLVVRD